MTQVIQPVRAHSVAEAYLYLMVASCPICQGGPLKAEDELTRTGDETAGWRVSVRCGRCNKTSEVKYVLQPEPTRESANSACINPTRRPSQAIDLLGWLNLFQSILSAAEKATVRASSRQLIDEAAACLDEALKFYDSGNDLPPETAFFNETSRRRFRDHPQNFSRSRWQQRRLMLPHAKAVTQSADDAGKRPWWRFWG